MPEIDTIVRQQVEEIGERLDTLERMVVGALGGNNSHPHPAPAPANDAGALVALEQTKLLRRIAGDLSSLPERTAERIAEIVELEEVEEDDEAKPKGKGNGKPKASAKPENDDDDGPTVPKRRGYFRDRDAD